MDQGYGVQLYSSVSVEYSFNYRTVQPVDRDTEYAIRYAVIEAYKENVEKS
jgi:hypothetical protein